MLAGKGHTLDEASGNLLALQKTTLGFRYEIAYGEDIRFRPFQQKLFQHAFRTRVAIQPFMHQRDLHGAFFRIRDNKASAAFSQV